VCYCVWCAVLVLLDVVGSGCGALRCRVRAVLYKFYKFYPSLAKTCKHLGSHNAMKHKQLLDLSFWKA